MNNKLALILVVVLAIVAVVLYRGIEQENLVNEGEPIVVPEGPANFKMQGIIVYEQYDDVHISPPFFRYADPEGNVGTSTLLITTESMCGDVVHMTPCMALSVSTPFNNEWVTVVGIQREDQVFVHSITRVE